MDHVRTARQHHVPDGTGGQDHHRRRCPHPVRRPRLRDPPSQSDPTWRVVATLYFTTDDSGYSWLDGALALWEGEFNEVTHHARYTAFT